jgi:hypothetical protein
MSNPSFASYASLGPRKFQNLYGGGGFPSEYQAWLVQGNQTPAFSGAPTSSTLLAGSVLYNSGGKAVLAGSGNASQVIGVLVENVETSTGDTVAAVAVTGSFDANSLLFAGSTNVTSMVAALNALNIYAEPSVVAAPPTANT